MNWQRNTHRLKSEGRLDDGWYYVRVSPILPDVWSANAQWSLDGHSYSATNTQLPDEATAKTWAEAALIGLQRMAAQLSEVEA